MLTHLLVLLPLLSNTDEAPWLGCWATAETTEFFWFEPERCGRLQDCRASFYRVDYDESGARLERWARFTKLGLGLKDDRLTVDLADRRVTLERCEVPRALRIERYELPEDVEVDPDTVAVVTEELRERRREDQRVRQERTRLSPDIARVDHDNTEFLRTLIEELGWIDAERFGRESAEAAFLLVQHSPDLRLMRTALPRIEKDVRAKRIDGQNYALLFDRVQLNLGWKQRYGSQIGITEQGAKVLMPCEDFESVDQRRSELGMGTLANYLKLFEEGGVAVRRLAQPASAPR